MKIRSPSGKDPLEEEMATHPSILAWKIPWTRGAWWAIVHGLTESYIRVTEHTCMQDTSKDYFLTSFMISDQMPAFQEKFFLIIFPKNVPLVLPYTLTPYIYFHGAYCYLTYHQFSSVQLLSCVRLFCDPMNRSTPGLPEFTETHIHRVSDAIQPSHPLSSPSPPAPDPSQHQGLSQ